MKITYQNELLKVNVEAWESDIRMGIESWNSFCESSFCDICERVQSARDVIMKLHEILEILLTEQGISREDLQYLSAVL